MPTPTDWFFWALLSAVFAALTAIFAKVGLEGVNSDYATLIRIFIVIAVLAAIVGFSGKWQNPLELRPKTLVFLTLSGLAPGLLGSAISARSRWARLRKLRRFDKLSLVLVALFAVVFLGERPGVREWVGIGMVGAGVVVLAWKR